MGLVFLYVWTRDGVPIPDATAPAYTPTIDDAGTRVAVRVTGSRIGAPPLTMTSASVAVTDPAEEQLAVNVARALRFGR